jgi:hypothetical protein
MGGQTLAYDGRWHLADQATADNLIPGRLKVSRRAGGRLKLYGSLARTSQEDVTPEQYRIIGRVGHRPWTLENCFPLRWSPINDEPERWYVELALSGVALDGGQELNCDTAIVRMRHLMGFIGQSGLRMDHPDRRKPFDGTLHVSKLPTVAHHYSGGTVSIKHQLHVPDLAKLTRPISSRTSGFAWTSTIVHLTAKQLLLSATCKTCSPWLQTRQPSIRS